MAVAVKSESSLDRDVPESQWEVELARNIADCTIPVGYRVGSEQAGVRMRL